MKFARGNRFHVLKGFVPAGAMAAFRASGVDLNRLAGRSVVVHGLLEQHPRWGPQIVVAGPDCVEDSEGS